MTNPGSICRIAVFYDGSYCEYAQRYFYHDKQLGWLSFQPLHSFLEDFVRQKEQGYSIYRVVYASWHQGLFTSRDSTDAQLKLARDLDHDLMHAGIEPKYIPMSQQKGREKGIDVALAVDALQTGQDGKVDVVVIVTGDGDFVPLVRALNKHGIRVLAAYFDYVDSQGNKGYINQRLRHCCNYTVDIAGLQDDKDFAGWFPRLFRKMNGN